MTRWPTKNWSLNNFVKLVDGITDKFSVVATGSPEDRIHIDRAFSGYPSERIINLAGDLSLTEFIAVMDQADVVETSFDFKTGHNLAKRPFNGKMVPADDPVLTEEVLQEIKESRPVSYNMEELRTIFCDNTFDSFKEVYAAERALVKEMKAVSRTRPQQVTEDLSMFE